MVIVEMERQRVVEYNNQISKQNRSRSYEQSDARTHTHTVAQRFISTVCCYYYCKLNK